MSNDSAPAPIVFSASQEWYGNDGKWSTFVVRVGTPEQDFRVLPSTSASETFVPVPEGCVEGDPANCGAQRGVYPSNLHASSGFQMNESSTWHEIGFYVTGLKTNLNYNVNGLYGLENLGLQVQNAGGPTLSIQVVAGFANKAFYLGLFGLSPKANNFSNFDHPQRSFITTLKAEKKIPSISYGYTAGAYYKTPKTLASLTIGGYDRSRFIPNNATFPFNTDDARPLGITIQRISAKGTLEGSKSLLDDPVYVEIDSTVPHLWLPRETCDRFQNLFGLTYDNSTDLYTVNGSIYSMLRESNPAVTFIMGSANPAEQINIAIPYRAFDLEASYPIYNNATRYFPIRRAANESQYTLGRTFLQEAYIVADYERSNFSIYQALMPASNEKQQIIPILEPNQLVEETDSHASRKSDISHPAIIGITVAAAIFIILCIACIILFKRRRRRARGAELEGKEKTAYELGSSEIPELPEHKEPREIYTDKVLYEMREPEHEIDGCSRVELAGDVPCDASSGSSRNFQV